MESKILLASDLDRTILPNGPQKESDQARPLLEKLSHHSGLVLAYVSGRHKQLVENAIQEYKIPMPNFVVGDVGTTIYEIDNGKWHAWDEWSNCIAPDWDGASRMDLHALFSPLKILELQESEKQNRFKLSYYTPTNINKSQLLEMNAILERRNIKAELIWSIDEIAKKGLLDVIPKSATKLHAVEFLMQRKGFSINNTVFSGDSGNDLPVLTSGRLQGVLVKNADPNVIQEAQQQLNRIGKADKLYLAKGDFLGMNGNYAAGVLEGLVHYIPSTLKWMQ